MDLRHFGDDLASAVERTGNPVLVGLDPRWELLPNAFRSGNENEIAVRATAYEKFCCEIIDVVAPLVPAVKPQAAFFEECGPAGMVALGKVIAYARQSGLLVILDGKRNDIGSTAEAYARGILGRDGQSGWEADALTVNPYLGADSLDPFLDVAQQRGAGLFVLVKTSNPGSHMLQDQQLPEGPVYRYVADYVETQSERTRGKRGYGIAGAVIGATYPEQLAELRSCMPQTWFLVPGFGSQGGTAQDVAAAFDGRGLGVVINNSRGINFAHLRPEYKDRFGDARWQEAVAAATKEMIAQLRAETLAGKIAVRT
ncbi:MAG TPA: orotidine-5'-phosphate decarboxylase [Planctomycetaceae bacterium]|nr:orotidine-5'-phosphate decarboxylase [Planctomycetaceae bacterium]